MIWENGITEREITSELYRQGIFMAVVVVVVVVIIVTVAITVITVITISIIEYYQSIVSSFN